MTKEELDFIGSMNMCDEISNEAYEKIVCHAEETIVSEDCVSRKAVKEGMIKYGFHAPDMTITEFTEDELPPVTPTRKGGKWISNVYQNRSCSICNYFISEDDVSEFNYCPNCGAEMRGSK